MIVGIEQFLVDVGIQQNHIVLHPRHGGVILHNPAVHEVGNGSQTRVSEHLALGEHLTHRGCGILVERLYKLAAHVYAFGIKTLLRFILKQLAADALHDGAHPFVAHGQLAVALLAQQ